MTGVRIAKLNLGIGARPSRRACIEPASDGSAFYALASAWHAGHVGLLSVEDGEVIHDFGLHNGLLGAVVSDDGRQAAAFGFSCGLTLHDLERRQSDRVLEGNVRWAAFVDGGILATALQARVPGTTNIVRGLLHLDSHGNLIEAWESMPAHRARIVGLPGGAIVATAMSPHPVLTSLPGIFWEFLGERPLRWYLTKHEESHIEHEDMAARLGVDLPVGAAPLRTLVASDRVLMGYRIPWRRRTEFVVLDRECREIIGKWRYAGSVPAFSVAMLGDHLVLANLQRRLVTLTVDGTPVCESDMARSLVALSSRSHERNVLALDSKAAVWRIGLGELGL